MNERPPSPTISSEEEELDETTRAYVEDPFTVKLCICCQRSVKFRCKAQSQVKAKKKSIKDKGTTTDQAMN